MAEFASDNIRNLVVVGHRGCGKTTLVEALLFAAGATKRLGSVEEGNTVTDFEPEEKERQMSIFPALAHCKSGGAKLNLIDAPGYAEFIGQVIPCLWVAETALLTVDAVAGVEVQTRRMWMLAREQGLAVVAVISRLDRERANFADALASLRESLSGVEFVPVQIPLGEEASMSGVVDLIAMQAYLGDSKTPAAIPAEAAEAAASARAALVDAVAATDDDLTMAFLENDALSEEELLTGLREAVRGGKLVPVLASAAGKSVGAAAALKALTELAPSPLGMKKWEGTVAKSEETVEVQPEDALSLVVFKTMSDPYVGRISLLRVVSGEAQADVTVTNANTGQRERLAGLSLMQGSEALSAGTLAPGDLGCVSKLEATLTGHTLCDPKRTVILSAPPLPEGMHAVALQAASRADQDKLSQALARIGEEDVSFRYERDSETGELVAHGMGPLHVDLAIQRLKRKFDVAVEQKAPRIAYRETIKRKVEVQGRHKKQTGGRGQFGDIWLRVEPLERGAGYEFVDEVVGGSVPRNFIPAVEKGVADVLARGPLAGYPVVDVRATLYDGSSHPVDSSEQAFRMAGQIGMRRALEEGSLQLLEPIALVEVTAPENLTGDIISDLNGKRGQILGMDSLGGGLQVVRARVPFAELAAYAGDLRSISQGRASYTVEFSHYQEVPHDQEQRIVAEAKAAQEDKG
ncbi:MAG: elongation factor G [candidate division WS1 bacterium]|nr:elongation factor G [candidate division WS1 bacterium]